MSKIVELLRRLNRKERFFLVGTALGKPDFQLDPAFRSQIEVQFSLHVPEDAFVAMDYHLTWIYAAIFLANQSDLGATFSNADGVIRGNQEDVDLLVAFEQAETTHIIILEAKGVTGFTNKQMLSKATRLREIFGEDGKKVAGVVPHFAIISPVEPKRLEGTKWPQWMRGERIGWLRLIVPQEMLRVTRSDAWGRPSATGNYWTTKRERDFS